MKPAMITLVIIVISLLIVWIRNGEDFHIAKILPFLGGQPPGFFDIGAIIMILITIAGLRRLRQAGGDTSSATDDSEDYIEDDEDMVDEDRVSEEGNEERDEERDEE